MYELFSSFNFRDQSLRGGGGGEVLPLQKKKGGGGTKDFEVVLTQTLEV